MPKFNVTIVRTIETVVEVEAASPREARRQVDAYGLVEATSDYKVVREDLSERIKKVEAQ